MVVTSALKVFSGIVATLFLGYCIYFDRVRHSDPCFRTKLRQRRQRERDRENQEFRCPVPPKCIENRQIYFLEQISLGLYKTSRILYDFIKIRHVNEKNNWIEKQSKLLKIYH